MNDRIHLTMQSACLKNLTDPSRLTDHVFHERLAFEAAEFLTPRKHAALRAQCRVVLRAQQTCYLIGSGQVRLKGKVFTRRAASSIPRRPKSLAYPARLYAHLESASKGSGARKLNTGESKSLFG